MAPRYAAETAVSTGRSRAEIEDTLARYGADAFGYLTEGETAQIAFRMAGRHVKIALPLPKMAAFRYTPSRHFEREPNAQRQAWEQGCRQRWRALALVIKAKLEAVECGITTAEAEFLADTILPDGETVKEWIEPQIAAAYRLGAMPTRLALPSPA